MVPLRWKVRWTLGLSRIPGGPNLISWVGKSKEPFPAVVRGRCDYGGMVRESQYFSGFQDGERRL